MEVDLKTLVSWSKKIQTDQKVDRQTLPKMTRIIRDLVKRTEPFKHIQNITNWYNLNCGLVLLSAVLKTFVLAYKTREFQPFELSIQEYSRFTH